MEERIDLKKFFRIIKKRWMTIVLVTLGCFLITGVISLYVMKPAYEASENIVVGKLKKDNNSYGESQELNMLLSSTIDFIKSPTVLNSVKAQINIGDQKLNEKLTVQNSKNSQIVNVLIRDHDPDKAKLIAHTIAMTTVDKMNELFGVTDIDVLGGNNDGPTLEKVGSIELNLAIGITVGFLLGIGGAMVREHLDDSIHSDSDIEGYWG
ncbi:Wzz/FepE/Etk N-terminal domain-containing protein [Halobacillus salinarum]|uniref:Wzz/FepE/Etk N-terminal domain-containing protein n=1 Tax=Halobacillus salinarum TaxID=2932257 RepID=A0ABY4ELT6_9BACI|nr:Wzz/FepE/Etk N-terminal domain-containing protein [Halobacillus salinarum]UOQ45413.1 Wzz/FepE/Etk N-terminal domain-containing protein [Halobacillus salinarum]